jgi:hypothetical protein
MVVIGHRAMLARRPEENISPSIRIPTENIEARHPLVIGTQRSYSA